ncbi:MAG: DUF4912 domain-containing protein [Candidatus Bruticola sp.]
MITRYSHTLPWSVSKLGQPSDLPDVMKEDLLLIVPVDPHKIFATWNISYQTQNKIAASLGEKSFASSRLIIRLEEDNQNCTGIIYDVSGPHRSRYLPVNIDRKEYTGSIRLYAQLGYLSTDNQFYSITGSSAILLPVGTSCGVQTDMLPIYSKACRRQSEVLQQVSDLSSVPHRLSIDLKKMAEILDIQMGRTPMPEGIHPQL